MSANTTPSDYGTYRRPVFNASRNKRGLDACNAALVLKRAVRDGEDPEEAEYMAEGEAAFRRQVLSNRCPHCNAPSFKPCIVVGSPRRTEMLRYHPGRTELAIRSAA